MKLTPEQKEAMWQLTWRAKESNPVSTWNINYNTLKALERKGLVKIINHTYHLTTVEVI